MGGKLVVASSDWRGKPNAFAFRGKPNAFAFVAQVQTKRWRESGGGARSKSQEYNPSGQET